MVAIQATVRRKNWKGSRSHMSAQKRGWRMEDGGWTNALSPFSILHLPSSLCFSPFILLRLTLHLSAEEAGADADHCRAFGDGGLVVVAHAHGEVAEVLAADLVPFHFLEDLAGAGEDEAAF